MAGSASETWRGPWISLFPIAYVLHIAEEAFCGVTFPNWASNVWGTDFTRDEFLTLNAAALTLMSVLVLCIRVSRAGHSILTVFAFAVTFNGAAHAVASLATVSYSPGTFTGVALFLPLGLRTLAECRRTLTPRTFRIGIGMGGAAHALISWLAFRG